VKLEGFMELRTPQVTTGEPLVATVGLRNVGDIPFVTAYARPGIFRGNSEIECTVTTLAGDAVLISIDSPNNAVVIEPNPDFIVKHGGRVPAIEPGDSIIAKRTVLLVQTVGDRRVWLQPGTYRIQAKIRIQRLAEEFTTNAETFTVKPPAPEERGILSIFTPDLASVLQGHGTRREQDVAVTKLAELREKFPRAPHRQYLDFQLLWFTPTREKKLTKANAYLEEFPKSPYVDDVLWALARMEREADEHDKAAAHLETLLRDHPDSPLKQEAEELQTKLKEALERAAIRKAAKEKEAAEENAAPSQDKGTGPP